MRKFFIVFLILIVTSIEAKDIIEAKINAYRAIKIIKSSGYHYVSSNGKYLKKGKYGTYKAFLYRGNSYFILGTGEKSVKDLDVQVYDKQWNIVAEDYRSEGALYTVKFKVKKTGIYYIRTNMYAGEGYYFQTIGWK